MVYGGIDQRVQDTVNAYRDNPDALQQKYALTNELLHLLALQKIRSDEKIAVGELKLSMSQNPKTIAAQREGEAVARATKEVTEGIRGVLAQKQAGQQQNMQRVAAGAGIAGQPAPNMARLAGGGIVAFAGPAGSAVGASGEVRPTDEQLNIMRITRAAWDAMLPEDRALAIKSRLNGDTTPPPAGLENHRATGSMRPAIAAKGKQAAAMDLARGAHPISTAPDREAAGEAATAAREAVRRASWSPRKLTAAAADAYPSVPKGLPNGYAEDTSEEREIANLMGAAPAVRTPGGPAVRTPVAPAAPPARAIGPTTAQTYDTRSQGGIKSAEDTLNRSGVAGQYKTMEDERRKLDESSAAERKSNALWDLMARAGGRGGLADIGRAASDERAGERLRRDKSLSDRQDIRKSGMTADVGIGTTAIGAGAKRAAALGKADSDKELRGIQREANRIQQNLVEARTADGLRDGINRGDKLIADATVQMQKLRDAAQKTDPILRKLQKELRENPNSEKAQAAVRDRVAVITGPYDAQLTKIVNPIKKGQRDAQRRLQGGGGGSGGFTVKKLPSGN